MEGTPFAVENSNEDDKEERKAQIKKPENLGILAVESPEEPQLSPLERVIAAIREPAPEAEKKTEAEEEPVVLPETEPPVERVPEEDARRIVHEMVAEPPHIQAEQEETPEPEPKPEAEPEPVAETEPAEIPEIDSPQAEAEPVPQAEEEPKVVTMEAEPEEPAKIPEVEPVEVPEPETVEEPNPDVEIEQPEPVEMPEEKPEAPPDDDTKKPGFIRSLFRRRDRKAEAEAEEEVEEQLEAIPAPESEKDELEGPEFKFNEKTEEPVEAPKVEAVPEQPEAEPQPEAQPAPERIGQMLLHVEDVAVEQPAPEASVSSHAAEEKMNVEASPTDPVSGKRVDTMSRGELMELGETIEVNGNNLRHIYETHLIGERGLRRLIAEHLQGRDLQEALRREVMEHEMDFERDPVMRDLVPAAAEPVTSNHEALEKFLQQAELGRDDTTTTEATPFTNAASQEPVRQPRPSYHYRPLDIGLAATISTLIVLIIIVFITRG